MAAHRVRRWLAAIAGVVAFLPAALLAQTQTVGALPGTFEVGPTGAASYRVPISVPPGIRGQAPGLALVYSSASGGGSAGAGWTLSGFSAVTRCNRTLASDGVVRGVRYGLDAMARNDRFCLDGQPLVVTSGSYGAPNAEYRKELSDYSKVTSLSETGTTGSRQPLSFRVIDRAGTTMTYGGTADSRIASHLPGGPIRLWMVDTIEDRFGNKIRFKYGQATDQSGEYWPTEVLWTVRGTDESVARYRVRVLYEDRPSSDVRKGWSFGAPWRNSKRITNVVVEHRSGGTWNPTFDYSLDYETSTSPASDRSRLASISLCSPDLCLPPTSIDWKDAALQFSGSGNELISEGPYTPSLSTQLLDFDGDGDTDLLGQGGKLFEADNGTYLAGIVPSVSSGSLTPSGTPFFFNSDAKQDLFYVLPSGQPGHVFESTGAPDQFTERANWIPARSNVPPGTAVSPYVPVDLDGDGCDEIAYIAENGGIYVHYNPCNGGSLTGALKADAVTAVDLQNLQNGGASGQLRRADFDGDGRQDLLVRTGFRSWRAYRSIEHNLPGVSFESMPDISITGGAEASTLTGDINGDGLTDIVALAITNGLVDAAFAFVSRGSSFEAVGQAGQQARAHTFFLGDANADGREDLFFLCDGSQGVYCAQLSIGDGFAASPVVLGGGAVVAGGWPQGSIGCNGQVYETKAYLVDVDVDGQRDLLYARPTCNTGPKETWRVGLKSGGRGDLVVGIGNAQGPEATIEYRSLAQAAATPLSDPQYQVSITAPPVGTRLVQDESQIVTSASISNGVGGLSSRTYWYRNGLRDLRGRGFLGFDRVTVRDSRDKVPDSVTAYRQDFPFIGAIQRADTFRRGTSTRLSAYIPTYTAHTSGAWTFPHLFEEATFTYGLNGALVTVTQRNLHGGGGVSDWNYTHGAPRFDVTSVAPAGGTLEDAWTTTIEYTYDSAPVSSNCLAMPTRVDETRTAPGASPRTRTTQFQNLAQSCMPSKATIGSATALSEQLVRNLYYDAYGNLDEEDTHRGTGPGVDVRRTLYMHGSEAGLPGEGYRLTRMSRRQSEAQPTCGGMTSAIDLHTDYTWDVRFGLLASEQPPTGDRTEYTYDGLGRVVLVNPSAQSSSDTARSDITYHACDDRCDFASHGAYLVVGADATGPGQVSLSWQVLDRLGRTVGTAGTLLSGNLSAVAQLHDDRGLVVATSIPFEVVPSVPAGATPPAWHVFGHDDLQRLVIETHPVTVNGQAETATTAYEYSGLSVTVTDAGNRDTQYTYFATGALASVVDANASPASYGYNGFGELVSAVLLGGSTRSFEYNSRGFMTAQSDADRGSWSFDYTPYGDVATVTDPMGDQVVTYYDMLGRPTTRTDMDCVSPGNCTSQISTSYTYRPEGQLGVVNTGGYYSEGYAYADRGRLTTVTTTLYGTTYFTDISYDSYGRTNEMRYPEIPSLGRYTYKSLYKFGHLEKVQESVGGLGFSDVYTALEMGPSADVTKMRFGGANGVVQQHVRDPRDFRLKGIQTGSSSGGPSSIQNLAYEWNKTGTLKWRKDLNQSGGLLEEFEYDDLDRLTKVTLANTVTQSLSYFANGNIQSKSDVGTYAYGQGGAFPHAVTSTAGAVPRLFHYDAQGRMDCRGAQTSACVGGNRIEWFIGGGVREINNGPVKTVFAYGGPERRRVSQVVTNANSPTSLQNRTINYVGDHLQVETEQATGRARYRMSVFAGGQAVYQRVETLDPGVGGAPPVAAAPQAFYLHRDHLGSVVQLSPAIQSGGSPGVTSYSFDAFGARRGTNWQASGGLYGQNHWTDRGFTGHEHLDDVELVHMNGRIEHPGIGRFLSPDPVMGRLGDPQSWNPYSYVRNTPLSLTDPSGYYNCAADSCPPELLGGTGFSISGPLGGDWGACSGLASSLVRCGAAWDASGVGWCSAQGPCNRGPLGGPSWGGASLRADQSVSLQAGAASGGGLFDASDRSFGFTPSRAFIDIRQELRNIGGPVDPRASEVTVTAQIVTMVYVNGRAAGTFADFGNSLANGLWSATPLSWIFNEDLNGGELAKVANPSSGMAILGLGISMVGGGPQSVAARSATQIARQGGRHAGQLQQFLKQTSAQLQRTISSFDKLIAKHEGWIANPSSKIPNFSQLRPEHQQNILHHWAQDISRHQELRSIAQDVLRGL